jgi:DinB superfamily
VAGCWSVRPREAVTSPAPVGAGDWVLDSFDYAARPRIEPSPPPFTTIAWRIGHLYQGFSARYEWTFGERKTPWDRVAEFTGSADVDKARLWALLERWHAAVAGLTDAQLDTVGFGQFPLGLDPRLPFIAIVWWTNQELIHHGAEVALLRDLWASTKERLFW